LQLLVKNNYAQESMRVSSKLSEVARQEGFFSDDDPQTPIVHNVPSPMTPGPGYSSELHIDPKTGIFVKQEPLEPVPDDDDPLGHNRYWILKIVSK
jgi:hypothetical protein